MPLRTPATTKRISVLYDISVFGLALRHEKAKTGVARVIEQVAYGLLAMPDLVELNFFIQSRDMIIQQDCLEYLANDPLFANVPYYIDTVPHCDVYHSPFYPLCEGLPCKVRVLTVYDLIPILFPDFFDQPVCAQIAYTLATIAPQDHVLAISHSTRDDLLAHFPCKPDHVHVTHLAACPRIFHRVNDGNAIDPVKRKYRIPEGPYLLSLCTLEPRKNLEHVIKCFARICRFKEIDDLCLVLTGAIGWDYDRIFSAIGAEPDIRKRIILTGFVPDNELAALYSGANAFIYMSKYEGFGLPPLEAMQCGVPVISSNTSSLPEVIGDAGIMIDPNDEIALCSSIVEIYLDRQKHRELTIKSLNRAAQFSWEQTALDTIKAYRYALDSISPPSETTHSARKTTILVDGVFFQLMNTGIARVWKALLHEWVKSDFANSILLLDRAGTAPAIPGLRTRTIPAYDYNATDSDRLLLQDLCDETGAELFVSSYYTTPLTTASLFFAYDMIPEVLGSPYFDLSAPMWREKHNGISHASSFIAISRNTARDLVRFYPVASSAVTIAYPAVDTSQFYPSPENECDHFKRMHGIDKPYYLFVGSRQNYKNGRLFFEGFSRISDRSSYDIVCVGGAATLEASFAQILPDVRVHLLRLSDDELRTAYSGAVCLIYPSLYEGFGLPILEAFACGCPVITCHNSSIPEAAGAAALYVGSDRPDEMASAMKHIQLSDIRTQLIKMGHHHLNKFSWKRMADEVREALQNTFQALRNLP